MNQTERWWSNVTKQSSRALWLVWGCLYWGNIIELVLGATIQHYSPAWYQPCIGDRLDGDQSHFNQMLLLLTMYGFQNSACLLIFLQRGRCYFDSHIHIQVFQSKRVSYCAVPHSSLPTSDLNLKVAKILGDNCWCKSRRPGRPEYSGQMTLYSMYFSVAIAT